MNELLRSRLLERAEASKCTDWLADEFSLPATSRRQLQNVIPRLLDDEQIKVLGIEAFESRHEKWKLVGLGVSGFVTTGVMDGHVARPFPFVLPHLLLREAAGERIFLTLEEIAVANRDHGVDLVVEYMQAHWDFTKDKWRDVAAIAHDTYKMHHCGYRLRRALQEGWEAQEQIYLAAGYRPLQRFLDTRVGPAGNGGPRVLFYADRQEAMQRAPGLPVIAAFAYREPRCGFSLTEQRVLMRAAEGMTDSEISVVLATTSNGVKQTWRSIYARASKVLPFMLAGDDNTLLDGKRGPEKRRRVVAFVNDHPEELRPFARGSRAKNE